MNNKQLGIYSIKEKKFFYLETGKLYISNTIDRIKNYMIQNDIIVLDLKNQTMSQQIEIMSIKEAKSREYTFVPVYINRHTKEHKNKSKNEKF